MKFFFLITEMRYLSMPYIETPSLSTGLTRSENHVVH